MYYLSYCPRNATIPVVDPDELENLAHQLELQHQQKLGIDPSSSNTKKQRKNDNNNANRLLRVPKPPPPLMSHSNRFSNCRFAFSISFFSSSRSSNFRPKKTPKN